MRALGKCTTALLSKIALALALYAGTGANGSSGDWLQLGGDPSGTRYSSLAQIDSLNVARLRIAWATDLGFSGRLQGAPAAWNGILFISTRRGVVAIDGATGNTRWRYDDGDGTRTDSGLPIQAPRGSPVVIPESEGATVVVSLPSAPVVMAFDALSGEPRWLTNVGRPDFAEALRTNPLLAGNVLVVGPTGADLSPVPGRLVAIKPHDGSIAWTFDTVPLDEDNPAAPTWSPYIPGRGYGVGGGSAWNVGAFDPVSGVLVFGTGQPVPSDQHDPRRYDGDAPASADLYTSSFVALDATTGELRWFHQVVPGDEWGYDQHTVPVIVNVSTGGRHIRTALLATTTGFLVMVDVTTGELLAAHKQFAAGNIHIGYNQDGNPIIDEDMRRTSADEVVRVCPGTRWASIAPGAYSPQTELLYRPNDTVCAHHGVGGPPAEWEMGERPIWLLAEVRLAEDYFSRWGALTALDPLTGEVAWSFEVPYPHDSGVLGTAGGLVFSGFADRQFRAFDAFTGEVLWSQVLTAHTDSAPITYVVDGVQYVAVMAGRDAPVPSLPESGLPASINGPATLFAFSLPSIP